MCTGICGVLLQAGFVCCHRVDDLCCSLDHFGAVYVSIESVIFRYSSPRFDPHVDFYETSTTPIARILTCSHIEQIHDTQVCVHVLEQGVAAENRKQEKVHSSLYKVCHCMGHSLRSHGGQGAVSPVPLVTHQTIQDAARC